MEIPHRWKADLLDYDNLLGATDENCCVCLSQRSMLMILAISDQFHFKTRYFADSGATIDTNIIDQWASKLEGQIVAGLDNCCGGGGLTRVNADGELEVSFDGGETWTPAPEQDPRNTSTRFPPLPGGSGDTTKCKGADNIIDFLTDFIDQAADIIEAGGTLTAVVAGATAIAAVFLSAGALLPLVVTLASAVVALGASSLRAAFDAGVYDAIRCCIYCVIADDASFSDGQFADLLECIASDVSGTAATVTAAIFQVMGAGGMSNVARTGSAAGTDCDECDCTPTCTDCVLESATETAWVTSSSTTPPSGWSVSGGVMNISDWHPSPGTVGTNVVHLPETLCVVRIGIHSGFAGDGMVAIRAGGMQSDFHAGTDFNLVLDPPLCIDHWDIITTGTMDNISVTVVATDWCDTCTE